MHTVKYWDSKLYQLQNLADSINYHIDSDADYLQNRPDFEGWWQMDQVSWLIQSARIDGDKIVINADW